MKSLTDLHTVCILGSFDVPVRHYLHFLFEGHSLIMSNYLSIADGQCVIQSKCPAFYHTYIKGYHLSSRAWRQSSPRVTSERRQSCYTSSGCRHPFSFSTSSETTGFASPTTPSSSGSPSSTCWVSCAVLLGICRHSGCHPSAHSP